MPTVSVKIEAKAVAKVKKQKKASGINVGKYFELAALEKLENDKKDFQLNKELNTVPQITGESK